MEFNIVNRLDLAYLDDKIKDFKETKKYNPYIFVCNETAVKMTFSEDLKDMTDSSNYVFEYCGCKVYFDNSLSYGDVRLR